ncbi:FAD-binding monooxygenase, PheA/TfdB family protein [Fulvimarina pelagi HTCC2506]|uniref:FAD-binding monooxygenase, PheA/TfdB family protein n=1 Tax=Fulvimarina pelagi HTCC2506 TaxID=314231 RepID=Q0G5A0_9HYPH|nr:FAD-dependent monooxygenase [Fulvimarina pelagi]EAU43164.1 FAD-binding monooxygenase, PheA/TfdB family protein [Fulvimarina pelagi HTCC2506]
MIVPADKPLVIAGAGPVGLALAVEAVRRGLDVRIVDRDEGPTAPEESRALGILPTTLAVLRASGVSERLLAEGQPIRRVKIAWAGRPAAEFSLEAASTPTPFILSLPQGRTERAMIDWLSGRGVEVEWGVELTGLEDTRSPTAILSTGERLAAYALAGCDGIHSAVRAHLDLPWVGDRYPTKFALADIRLRTPIEADCVQLSLGGPNGTRAFLPFCPDFGRLIGVVDDPQTLVDERNDIASVGWTSSFEVAFHRAERMSRGMVFLAGDAAHEHSPVGGRGMNLGIWDAAWLAYLLSEKRASEYEMRRMPSVKKVLEQTRSMTDTVTAPPRWTGAVLRFALPAALKLPLVRRRIANRLLALDLPQPVWL